VGAGAAAWALFTVVSAAAAPNRPAIFLSMFPLWNLHNQRLRGRGDNSHASTWFLDSARRETDPIGQRGYDVVAGAAEGDNVSINYSLPKPGTKQPATKQSLGNAAGCA
jgi:hypothetical protein